MLNLHRDKKKIVGREPGRDGKVPLVTTGRAATLRPTGYKRETNKNKQLSVAETLPHYCTWSLCVVQYYFSVVAHAGTFGKRY